MKPSHQDTDPRICSAAAHYRKFCEELGIDLSKEDTKDTPMRVAKMFAGDFTEGMRDKEFNFTSFEVEDSQRDQLVIMCGIKYASLCQHHHLPFTGLAHICYLPDKKLAGLSKLARLVKWVAHKPSVQETLIGEILSKLVAEVSPRFAGLSMSGVHHCMTCRGVRETNAITMNNKFYTPKTVELNDHSHTRDEFMQSINQFYKLRGLI